MQILDKLEKKLFKCVNIVTKCFRYDSFYLVQLLSLLHKQVLLIFNKYKSNDK